MSFYKVIFEQDMSIKRFIKHKRISSLRPFIKDYKGIRKILY